MYYHDGYYTILVLIKNLKVAGVLQMLSLGFRAFGIFAWFIYLVCIQK